VTRGTRLKKPSSSRGLAREARGAQGSWRLKTENRKPNIFFLSFLAGNNYPKKYKNKNFERPHCVCADASARPQGTYRGGRGAGRLRWERAGPHGHTPASVQTPLCPRGRERVRTDTSARPRRCVFLLLVQTVKTRPRVKMHPRGKCGRARTSGRRLWMSGRNGRLEGKFYCSTLV
jgi:hypothetical protein